MYFLKPNPGQPGSMQTRSGFIIPDPVQSNPKHVGYRSRLIFGLGSWVLELPRFTTGDRNAVLLNGTVDRAAFERWDSDRAISVEGGGHVKQSPVFTAFHVGQRAFEERMSEMLRSPQRGEERDDLCSVSLKGRVASFPGLPRTPNLRSYSTVWSRGS